MGWCSLILVSVVLMHHGTLKPNPLDELTMNLNLNDAPNGGRTVGSPIIKSEEWKTGKTSTKGPSCCRPRHDADKKRKRILGGEEYDPEFSFPSHPIWEKFIASIRIVISGPHPPHGMFELETCGGVLISNQHILTALHCVSDSDGTRDLYPLDKVSIFFDEENAEVWKGTKFEAAQYLDTNGNPQTKPEYLPNTSKKILKDDIVVIKLDRKITELKGTCLVPIPISKGPFRNLRDNKYFIAGWGVYDLNQPNQRSLKLKYTNKLPAMPCPDSNDIQQSTNICFQRTNRQATCHGDSGSPGVVSLDKVWHLQGIHQGGHKMPQYTTSECSEPQSISVDIDVSQYREQLVKWIYN